MPDEFDQDAELEQLEQLTEQIQMGDTTEGAQALKAVLSRAQAQGANAVRQELAKLHAASENQAAANRFIRQYPVVRSDPEVAKTIERVARDHVVEDLRTAGYEDAAIAAAGDDLNKLGQMHEAARVAGCKVRDPKRMMTDIGTALEKDHGVQPGRAGEERARNLEWFNRTREARGYTRIDGIGRGPRTQSAPQRRTPREVVDDQRAARGYPAK